MHLNEEKVGLLIVDIQGTLARRVSDSEAMVCKTAKLIQCCKLLDIPVVVLEQNPDGLGGTVPEIETLVASDPHFKKFTFNALAGTDQCSSEILAYIGEMELSRWLVVGIETHVCVYQTVTGLLENNHTVEVIQDCISSRESSNALLAIDNMRERGAQISSFEMTVFELLKSCQHPKFREVLALIK
ncbi:isochorismatase family protein [Alteromonas gracilis]|uniref:isochorismatase family protein n=1 Tax=Alteromonas gracilis TaxID=1479524 RepID=UPI002FE195E5